MSEKTARHYRDDPALPSERRRQKPPRTYRTRIDPFAAVWAEVEAQLRAEPKLAAKTLFDWLRGQHPGQFLDSHRRTFERRVRQWRASDGPGPNRPRHVPADPSRPAISAASDFTHMNSIWASPSRGGRSITWCTTSC